MLRLWNHIERRLSPGKWAVPGGWRFRGGVVRVVPRVTGLDQFIPPRRDPFGPESSGGVGPESSGGVWGLNSLGFEGPVGL